MSIFAARALTDTKKFDHISPVLQDVGWLSVKDLLCLRDGILVCKCVHGLAPHYLSSKLVNRLESHSYNITQKDNVNVLFSRTATIQRSFHYRALKAWNCLSSHTQNSSSA